VAAHVVVLDYGSGNVRSAVRMLERVGASVELSADHRAVLFADGLFVPGVGNFHACMRGLRAVDGPRLIDTEPSAGGQEGGLGEWPGVVERLAAAVVPHMGWSTVKVATGSRLFAGVEDERFYFVHSYAALGWTLEPEGRWWPHSSTLRSPGTPERACWRTGWRRCDR